MPINLELPLFLLLAFVFCGVCVPRPSSIAHPPVLHSTLATLNGFSPNLIRDGSPLLGIRGECLYFAKNHTRSVYIFMSGIQIHPSRCLELVSTSQTLLSSIALKFSRPLVLVMTLL